MDNLLAQIKNMQRINPKLRLAGALITMRTRADGVDAAEAAAAQCAGPAGVPARDPPRQQG
ncbi:MAG: hypothetical protein ACLU3I_05785 [Acutalibacteraceae bacterium]